jgi:hypothetical protein
VSDRFDQPSEEHEQPRPFAGSLERLAKEALGRGATLGQADDSSERREVAASRRRTGTRSGADIRFATGRPKDPLWYWEQNNIPYDITKDDELQRLRDYCRAIYMTHPVIGSAVDIYSKYPLVGMELTCKDPALTEFYTELFFDQLDYEEYLVDVGREYWTVGEAFSFGSFNETLGVWEDDELLNPNDVSVIRSPFMKQPRFEMRLPETIRQILQNREPAWEYEALMRSYPELANFLGQEDTMPVSNVLLQHIKFKGHAFHSRGVPLLMRAIRSLVQEEMMNAAQDAVADRLYTPLILARLGASASDLGTQRPWVPTQQDRDDFMEALDTALAADFRILVSHFAVQLDPVLGREMMPRLEADFERLTEKQLQVFGLSKTMLSGSSGGGQTYAGDALNRDLVTQLLTTYQRKMARLFRQRALVVAEAQEHYDFEERAGRRYPVMEEVLIRDPETGEQRIQEQPKLLVPEIKFRAMNLRDEQGQRDFVEAMRASGVPISMKTRLTNAGINLDDEREQIEDEQIEDAVRSQQVRKRTYERLRDEGLPIPEDLKADFEPKAVQSQDPDAPGQSAEQEQPQQVRLPSLGLDAPADTAALAPDYDDVMGADTPGRPDAGQQRGEGGDMLPRNRMRERTRPEESDEMRASMPKPGYRVTSSNEGQWLVVTAATEDHDGEVISEHPDEDAARAEANKLNREAGGRMIEGPRHVGSRGNIGLDQDTPLDEWESSLHEDEEGE